MAPVVGAGRTNIHAFGVMKRVGRPEARRGGDPAPERWFNPVPPTNPCIQAQAGIETA